MRTILCVACAGALLAAAGAAAATASPQAVAPARFGWLPHGWRGFDDAPVPWTNEGATSQTFATSWPYRQGPGGPLGRFPRGATFVWVHLVERCAGVRSPRRRLPLRLPRTTAATLEGEPGIPEYRVLARIGAYDVEVRVDVNARRPSAAQLDRAARVVAALRFPHWPSLASC